MKLMMNHVTLLLSLMFLLLGEVIHASEFGNVLSQSTFNLLKDDGTPFGWKEKESVLIDLNLEMHVEDVESKLNGINKLLRESQQLNQSAHPSWVKTLTLIESIVIALLGLLILMRQRRRQKRLAACRRVRTRRGNK